MRQGIDTLEVEPMAEPQAQDMALLAAMEDPAMTQDMGDPSMVPEGGIQGLGAMEEEAMVPEGGIQGLSGAAEMLAQAGREGDIYIVHASEGDTVVPQDVLEGPGGAQIREMLFRQMAEMGVDPERYVVGNELNSMNPETGLPEFFFKKAFAKVKSFFKKAAPIVLPMLLSMTPLGPILGAAAGSGIASYLGGGSAKDALKAAAIGGVTAGFLSGVSGAMGAQSNPNMSATQGFMEGVKSGLPEGFAGSAFGSPGSESPLNPGTGPGGGPGEQTIPGAIYDKAFPQAKIEPLNVAPPATARRPLPTNLWRDPDSGRLLYINPPPAAVSPSVTRNHLVDGEWVSTDTPGVSSVSTPAVNLRTRGSGRGAGRAAAPAPFDIGRTTLISGDAGATSSDIGRTTLISGDAGRVPISAGAPAPRVDPIQARLQQMETSRAQNVTLRDNALKAQNEGSFLPEATRDYLIPGWGGNSPDVLKYQRNINALTKGIDNLAITRNLNSSTTALNAGLSRPLNASNEYSQYGIPLALAGAAAYFGGAFDEPEQDPPSDSFASRPISDTAQYRLFPDGVTRAVARAPVDFTSFPTLRSAAHGGEMQNFPPRIGAISGPGTEKSDDVPAMLSDGEFVMTAQAVRGAGGGSRERGVQTLYELMRNFEATV